MGSGQGVRGAGLWTGWRQRLNRRHRLARQPIAWGRRKPRGRNPRDQRHTQACRPIPGGLPSAWPAMGRRRPRRPYGAV